MLKKLHALAPLDHLRPVQTSKHCCLVKIGAQVMLLRNLELTGNDRMLVNGSRGVITAFKTKEVCGAALHCAVL